MSDPVRDRLEIDDLLTAYAAGLDTGDWDRVRACCADDAVLDYSDFDGPRGGVDEVVAWIETSLQAFEMVRHHLTNRQVEIDGDEARAVSYLFNPMVPKGGPKRLWYVGGTYRDRLVHTPDGWRIAERIAEQAWTDFGRSG